MTEVEKGEFKICLPIRRSQVYERGAMMNFSVEVRKFPPINLHWLMHT